MDKKEKIENGKKYIGKFNDEGNLIEGEVHFSDGLKYIGKFDEKYLIEGEIHYPDGKKYIGKFKDGYLIEGEVHYPKGTKEIGKFNAGYFIEGEIYFPNGDKHIGKFKNAEIIEGEIRHKDGSRLIGKFEEGECFRHIDKNGNESYTRLVLESYPSGHRPISFEEYVSSKRKLKTKSGLMVQSIGEQEIANFLCDKDIDFNYDKQITFTFNEPNKYGHKQEWVRPDFYLTEFAIIIEYWGMKGDPDYDDKKDWKERIYAESKTKYISIYKEDLPDLEEKLEKKLKRLGVNV